MLGRVGACGSGRPERTACRRPASASVHCTRTALVASHRPHWWKPLCRPALLRRHLASAQLWAGPARPNSSPSASLAAVQPCRAVPIEPSISPWPPRPGFMPYTKISPERLPAGHKGNLSYLVGQKVKACIVQVRGSCHGRRLHVHAVCFGVLRAGSWRSRLSMPRTRGGVGGRVWAPTWAASSQACPIKGAIPAHTSSHLLSATPVGSSSLPFLAIPLSKRGPRPCPHLLTLHPRNLAPAYLFPPK